MSTARKFDLDRRLEAYFATLRPASLKEVLKRSAGNWQIYAAVTGSAMAMATTLSASNIGVGAPDITPESIASVLAAKQFLASTRHGPLINAVRLAMARQGPGALSINAAVMKMSQATAAQAPTISPGGIVPIFGRTSIIQPGEWVSIYGTGLAANTAFWNGDFPTLLGGTSVEIDGKPAYLEFVSPDQINVQAPDDTAKGTVSVVVTTAAGSATASVTLNDYAPSFSLLDTSHVAGIIIRTDGSGAYGGGTYDLLGPTGSSLGYPTVAAKAGDIVELFGVGFGPTNPAVPAGEAFSGAAAVNNPINLYINGITVTPTFVGLSSAGLYQINLIVPTGLGEGEVPMRASAGGIETQPNVLFSLQTISGSSNPVTGGGTIGVPLPPLYFTSTPPTTPGTSPVGVGTDPSTGGGGGTGGGTGDVRRKIPYQPKLRFPPA
jgi:uncharacterized protein (TIGR03437 family)